MFILAPCPSLTSFRGSTAGTAPPMRSSWSKSRYTSREFSSSYEFSTNHGSRVITRVTSSDVILTNNCSYLFAVHHEVCSRFVHEKYIRFTQCTRCTRTRYTRCRRSRTRRCTRCKSCRQRRRDARDVDGADEMHEMSTMQARCTR